MLIAVSHRDGLARIALLCGDDLQEYHLWRPARPDGVGDVYTGRVTAIAPAMAGAFLDLGAVTGFLPDRGKPTIGDILAVRVTRAAQNNKGPRLERLAQAAADRPGLRDRGEGPLRELARRYPQAQIILDDHGLLATLRPDLERRLAYRKTTFDPILEDEIAALSAPTAILPQGAVMHITPTAAVTTIDIDAAAAAHIPALALNQAIIPELARQILLRNLSGGIVIDFAGMKSRERPKLQPPLAAALARDPLRPRLLGFSHLGFAEITRPRIRPPLHELLA